ncbi:MAG: PspC family transcriptional regulator, partial [bacterium]|nr:PspC family transcriptional regulator [bacterium]
MKKTISVNLGGRMFYIDEDAYAMLDAYTSEVKLHFASYPDHDEIITDIESRMAEHFESKSIGSQTTIVTLKDVEGLIAIMGRVKDFDDTEHSATSQSANTEAKGASKLYR